MKRSFAPLGPLLAAGIALVAALVMALGLSSLDHPDDLAGRLQALNAAGDQGTAILRKALPASPLPADAMCASAAAGSETLRREIASLAAKRQLRLNGLSVTTGLGGETTGPIRVRIDASGAYGDAVGFTADLDRLRPAIFIDTAALSTAVKTADVSVTGRAFCLA